MRAIVVSWNSGATLDRCLRSLTATRWPTGQLEVVVVDNGSTDGSVLDWDRRHPGVELRQTGANLGFGAAANRALTDLEGLDAVALVNPDAFVDPDWLEPLAAELDGDPRLGAACPKILLDEPDPSGRPVINNVGNELGARREPHDRGLGEIDEGQYDVAEDVWGWCGGGVLLRRTYLDAIGLFDESLFLYCEDVDLSWRGRGQGWRYRYVPQSVIRHVHRASSGGQRTPLLDYLNRRNRLVVVTRHGGRWDALVAWALAAGGTLVCGGQLLVRVACRRPLDASGLARRVRAMADAVRLLRGLPGRLPTAATTTPIDHGARR